jgi:hypothetical protein
MMSINHILHGALKDDTIVEYDFSKFVQSELLPHPEIHVSVKGNK